MTSGWFGVRVPAAAGRRSRAGPGEATASASQCCMGQTPRRHRHRCGHHQPTASPQPRAEHPWGESQANRRPCHNCKELRFTRSATGAACLILLCQVLVAPVVVPVDDDLLHDHLENLLALLIGQLGQALADVPRPGEDDLHQPPLLSPARPPGPGNSPASPWLSQAAR